MLSGLHHTPLRRTHLCFLGGGVDQVGVGDCRYGYDFYGRQYAEI